MRGGTTSSQQDTCRLCLPTATSWRAARADTGSTVKRLQAAFRAGFRAGSASTGIHAEIRARPAASTPRARSFADKWCRRPAWHRTCLRTAHAGAGFERAGIQHPVDSASSSLASTWWQGDTWWAGRGAGREPYIYIYVNVSDTHYRIAGADALGMRRCPTSAEQSAHNLRRTLHRIPMSKFGCLSGACQAPVRRLSGACQAQV